MSQNVIAARDVEVYINFDAIGTAMRINTAVTVSNEITGETQVIPAVGTSQPVGIDNGSDDYPVSVTMQEAEAQKILDALAAATAGNNGGSIVHIRQVVEAATITIVHHKRRDVPAVSHIETYTGCTGVSESSSVERGAIETQKQWQFRARAMQRTTVPL